MERKIFVCPVCYTVTYGWRYVVEKERGYVTPSEEFIADVNGTEYHCPSCSKAIYYRDALVYVETYEVNKKRAYVRTRLPYDKERLINALSSKFNFNNCIIYINDELFTKSEKKDDNKTSVEKKKPALWG